MRRGMKAISLWHCLGVMEAQVALIAAFKSKASSLLLVHIFLPNFFLPVNFACNMLWHIFWTIAKSALFPIETQM